MARQVPAAGVAGATGDAGNAGDGHGAICDDAGNEAGATDYGAAAGGDVAVIPIESRKTSDSRGSPRQRALSTGSNTREEECVPQSDECCGATVYNQRHPNSSPPLQACHASERSSPIKYQETMDWEHSEY